MCSSRPAPTTAGSFACAGVVCPGARATGERGDLYAVVNVQVPQQLSDEERALWEKLGRVSRFNPRSS